MKYIILKFRAVVWKMIFVTHTQIVYLLTQQRQHTHFIMAKETRKSHINGLPIVLESMLNHLLTISDLKSWSMYQNKDSLVSLNIRFSDKVDDNVVDIDMPVSYRKVPARQLRRSRQRALDHNKPTDTHIKSQNNNIANINTPDTPVDNVDNVDNMDNVDNDSVTNVMKKRKLDNLTPELLNPEF